MLEIKMKYTKSTKGTHVYTNDAPDTAVPTLYVKRGALPDKPPAEIKLTVEFN